MIKTPLNRAVEIAGFLSEHGWGEADEVPFLADFSSRRYARLTKSNGQSAVLMDADPDQKTASFVVVAKLLKRLEISAPEIIASQAMAGLVLMEDFGNSNIGKLLDQGHGPKSLYLRATDVLLRLHKNFSDNNAEQLDLPVFGGALFSTQVELFLDSYFVNVKKREPTVEESESFRAAWKDALRGTEALPQTLMLRDFMPDNLMDLENRKGAASLGVLDFQDAGLGPITYDLASLCEVVRRDGGDIVREDVLAHYDQNKSIPSLSLTDLKSSIYVLSAQRHMRILGVIAGLAHKTGDNQKLVYLPRIWNYLDQLLQHEKLKSVEAWVNTYMPQNDRDL